MFVTDTQSVEMGNLNLVQDNTKKHKVGFLSEAKWRRKCFLVFDKDCTPCQRGNQKKIESHVLIAQILSVLYEFSGMVTC